MATCKDCMYFPMCKNIAVGNMTITSDACECFADKSRFVELPCKVGDTVYYLGGIHRTLIKSAIVEEIIINCNGISDLFVTADNCSFENSFDIFFTSKEEAEAALAERRNE